MEGVQRTESSSDGNSSWWWWYESDASFTAGVYCVDDDETLTVTVSEQR